MEEYNESTYGERIAAMYDAWHGEYEPPMVDFLQELAMGGPALELGIGSGRVAVPLHERWVEVRGIDASHAMISRLHAKPGGASIPVTHGSFAEFDLGARFGLVYVVFNTFFALLTHEEQMSCFRCVARHLTDDGAFVLEAFVPDMDRFKDGQDVRATHVGIDEVRLDVTLHDRGAQQVSTQHVVLSESGIRLYPVKLRYAWPNQLDGMAYLAGLRLKHRWATWAKGPFTADSKKHISVYGRAESGG